jgi:glycerophosphoryl diester phosphodiesterase
MADIVQLKENGVPKYLKTHIAAVDGKASNVVGEFGLDDQSYMTPATTAAAISGQVVKESGALVQYIAHRGSNADYPENSSPAFRAVTRHWGIETDIQVTSDGTWICMHDSTVDRTTNGTGTVASKTLAQIKALRIDTGNNLASLSDVDKQVPTFDEFLAICKTNGRVPIIEIKAGSYTQANYDAIITSLNKYNLKQGVVFISFDYQALVEIKKRLPVVPVQYLVNSISDKLISDAKALGVNATLDVKYNDASVTANNLIKIHAAGLSAGCWTVPDTQFDAMIAMGFDYITTDSKSGNRKWAKLILENEFTIPGGGTDVTGTCFVEMIDSNSFILRLSLADGSNTRGTVITKLPEWATPLNSRYTDINIRTSSGVGKAALDILGKASANPSVVKVSFGWDARTTWAQVEHIISCY